MVTVSNGWKAAHNEMLLPETFIEVTYNVSEPGIENDATTAGTSEERFSKAAEITNAKKKAPERYATLEQNLWGLDGTFEYFDGTPMDPGYTTTSLSSSDLSFSSFPTIRIRFTEPRTELVPGITITWGSGVDEWATSFRITVYNGTTLVMQEGVTENASVVSKVWMDLENYDQIIIEVFSWSHPNRRCRVVEVFLGIQEVYTKAELLGYEHSESVDLLSAALPKNEIKFRLENSTGRWNPNNPTGAERYLLERQKIDVRYGMLVNGSVEWINAGTYWLSEWNTPANGLETSFTARDALNFMNEVYTGVRFGTLQEIANAAFVQANLPVMPDGTARYYVDSALALLETDFSEDGGDYTIADILQMVAHAASCVFYQDRDGKLRIERRNKELTDYVIDPFKSFAHPEFALSKPLRAVAVTYGDNLTETVVAGATGEVQTVSNSFIKTAENANAVADNTIEVLAGRKTISGDFRADPRLAVLDVVTVESKYATNQVAITDIKYSTTGGALRGAYTGRVVG